MDFVGLHLADLTSFVKQHIFPENSVQTSKILWRSVLDAFFLAQDQEKNFTFFQKISCESNLNLFLTQHEYSQQHAIAFHNL